jgi:hypothetical protein
MQARLDAVLKRLVTNKDNLSVVSLFAWGRMTFTIKAGGSRELWKPKRAEALAIFAHIYQNRKTLFATLAPGYEFVFEDASTARNTVGISAPADEADFVALQKELDTHWGVHKRKMCPALRHPSALMRPMSPSLISGSLAPSSASKQASRGPSTPNRASISSPEPTSPRGAPITQFSTLTQSYPLQFNQIGQKSSTIAYHAAVDTHAPEHRVSWPPQYIRSVNNPDSAMHSTRCPSPASCHSASTGSPRMHEPDTESAAEALLMMSSSAPSQSYRTSQLCAPAAWGYGDFYSRSQASPPQRYHPYRSRSAPDAKPSDGQETTAVGEPWRPW